MKALNLEIVSDNGSRWKQFDITRMVNAGYVGRDSAVVQAHIDELKKIGVPPPPRVPMIFPVVCDILTTGANIEVFGNATSGEVEFVLIIDRDAIFVGVGSDHTDRELEASSLVKSKQICSNVLSAQVWPFEDVASVWDELIMRSWVKDDSSGQARLYQEAALGKIISPYDLMQLVKAEVIDSDMNGMAIYSGTIPLVGHEALGASSFRAELCNPHSGKTLSCEYQIHEVDFLRVSAFT